METCAKCNKPIDPINIAWDGHSAFHDYCLEDELSIEESEPDICPRCVGSGETISGAPGNCSMCGGSGMLYASPDPDDYDWDDNRDDE